MVLETTSRHQNSGLITKGLGTALTIHVYGKDPTGGRGHEDIPVEELAAIAAPFIRLRIQDAAVLRKMAEEFQLDRPREATRARFETALQIARQSVIPS